MQHNHAHEMNEYLMNNLSQFIIIRSILLFIF